MCRDLIESLRWDLSPSEEERTPVFPFVYDWRQDNVQTARQLGEFIVEVIERANLVKHYQRRCACVDLVGHSLGGVVLRQAILDWTLQEEPLLPDTPVSMVLDAELRLFAPAIFGVTGCRPWFHSLQFWL